MFTCLCIHLFSHGTSKGKLFVTTWIFWGITCIRIWAVHIVSFSKSNKKELSVLLVTSYILDNHQKKRKKKKTNYEKIRNTSRWKNNQKRLLKNSDANTRKSLLKRAFKLKISWSVNGFMIFGYQYSTSQHHAMYWELKSKCFSSGYTAWCRDVEYW